MVNHAVHLHHAFISINRLRNRVSDFMANNWIMDSGAFTEISTHGSYRTPVEDYAKEIERWSRCGTLELAVAQDYMCEPFILEKTRLSVKEHQRLTIERYDALVECCRWTIMPVLQGYETQEYLNHIRQYGSRLKTFMRVGVGSVCKRNGSPYKIEAILLAIKQIRPDLRLHGFGLKKTALQNDIINELLYSSDSIAWSYQARRNEGNGNRLEDALAYERGLMSFKRQGRLC